MAISSQAFSSWYLSGTSGYYYYYYYYYYWDRDSVVDVPTRPRILRSVVRIPEGARQCSLLQNRQNGSASTQTPIASGNLVLVLG